MFKQPRTYALLFLATLSGLSWAAPDSAAVAQCRQSNQRAHGEVMQMYQQARSGGQISPAEQQQFHAMEARLHRHRDLLARNGLTLAECQHLSREIANERAQVQRMAASGGHHHQQLQQCRQNNQRAHGEVMQMYQQARANGQISPAEQQQFHAMEARLHRHRDMLARNGLTLAECQHLSREIANERAQVQRMAASGGHHHQQLQQCRQNNRRAHEEVVQMFHQARAEGRISINEHQQFQRREEQLRRHYDRLAHDGLTLQECQHIGREIANERAQVQRMSRH